MLGKILIVDQIATNRIALRAKLGAAQFDVSLAGSIEDTLRMVNTHKPDLVLSTTDLVDGSALDLVDALNLRFKDRRPPLLFLCAPSTPDDTRIALLRAGAEDVVSRPVDDVLLLARIRTQVRASYSDAELQLRDDTSRALGLAETASDFLHPQRISLIGSDEVRLRRLSDELKSDLENARVDVTTIHDLAHTPFSAAPADAYVLLFGDAQAQGSLRLLSTLRSHRASRNAAILVMQTDPDPELAAYALDIGASDLVDNGAPLAEISLRLRALLRRKQQADQLRANVRNGLEAAVSDPLTGLHNRRYAIPHLERMLERAVKTRKPVAVMVADMDHFKQVNDVHGHAVGDAVLIETAARLRENLRAVDLVARIGGEEFLIVLPGITLENARKAGQRICHVIADTPFATGTTEPLHSTISVGLTVFDPHEARAKNRGTPSPQSLIVQADKALYQAKEKGRNRVRMARPAA